MKADYNNINCGGNMTINTPKDNENKRPDTSNDSWLKKIDKNIE